MELKMWPWENGVDPYFINEEGYEWYIDKSTTQYAQKDKANGDDGLKNVYAFIVADDKKEDIMRVLIDDNQNVLHEGLTLEGIAAKIDLIRVSESV